MPVANPIPPGSLAATRLNRRRFLVGLGAGLSTPLLAGACGPTADASSTIVPATGGAPEPPATSTPIHSGMDPWVELNANNMRHNVAEIARRVENRPILGVIKNNGYGGGLVEVARILDPLPEISHLAVVRLHEAATLRDAGVTKPILMLGPLQPSELEDAVAMDVRPGVYTPVGDTLEKIAANRGASVKIHVHTDTGLGREGVPVQVAADLMEDLAGRKGVEIEGTLMTFVETEAKDQIQMERFAELRAELDRRKIDAGLWHAATSSALHVHPDAFMDAVRPGFALFGGHDDVAQRDAGAMDLRPTHALRARVIYVKQLRKGDSVAYGSKYSAPGSVWVATLPLGHADGYPRSAVEGGKVRIGGRMYPVIGSVSASSCVVELGPEKTVEIGDVATFFDWESGSHPDEFGWSCGTSPYDVLMHINPLLPRVVI